MKNSKKEQDFFSISDFCKLIYYSELNVQIQMLNYRNIVQNELKMILYLVAL